MVEGQKTKIKTRRLCITSTYTKDLGPDVHFLYWSHGTTLNVTLCFCGAAFLLQCTLCPPHLLLPRSYSRFFSFLFDMTPLLCLVPAVHTMCWERVDPCETPLPWQLKRGAVLFTEMYFWKIKKIKKYCTTPMFLCWVCQWPLQT